MVIDMVKVSYVSIPFATLPSRNRHVLSAAVPHWSIREQAISCRQARPERTSACLGYRCAPLPAKTACCAAPSYSRCMHMCAKPHVMHAHVCTAVSRRPCMRVCRQAALRRCRMCVGTRQFCKRIHLRASHWPRLASRLASHRIGVLRPAYAFVSCDWLLARTRLCSA